ncbi:MAG TPA: mechanosensitive ion channel domain-containing protein [Bacteroidia bacterium]|jgi:small conductance mechanosensitive channel|nr:mechanosensitive ion channel domain-containing protein [Bacteroidia bacterium]
MAAEPVIKTDIKEEVSFLHRYTKDAYEFAVEYTPKIIIGILVLIIGFWLIKQLGKLTEKTMKRRELDVSLRTFLRSLIGIGLKIILLITVAGMIGIQTTSLVTILGAAGLAVGLALQGSLSNFAGGVLILIFKPYKVGDTIEAMGQKGEVREIQIFNTILVTSENKTVILPNGSVSNSIVVNQSRQGSLRAAFEVVISNEHDAERVRKILLEIIEADKRVVHYPFSPSVICTKTNGGGYTLQARFFTMEINNSVALSDLMETANKELAKRNISGPLEKMVVYQE